MNKQQLQNRINFHKSAIEGHKEQMAKDQKTLEELAERFLLTNYNNYKLFDPDIFTKDQLITDNVPNMSKLERIAYLYAKYHDMEWLSEDERLDAVSIAYCVSLDASDKEYEVLRCKDYADIKWFKNRKDAQQFCDWANKNIDWKGDKKCQTK